MKIISKKLLRVDGTVKRYSELQTVELGVIRVGDEIDLKNNHHYYGLVDRISEYEGIDGESEIKVRIETDDGELRDFKLDDLK